ncbi:hypothetical protein E4U14_001910 [Claviceps sp. LM454 group G7]|nr:hypothetical protein E4U14_001910 [Claviceps sp. LM454 group G7]
MTSLHSTTTPVVRRRKIGHRRRVEDEGDEDGRAEAQDLDDDSLTEVSVSDDDADHDSDTSNIEEASPKHAADTAKQSNTASIQDSSSKTPVAAIAASPAANGNAKKISDTEMMLHGLSNQDKAAPTQELHFDEAVPSPPKQSSAPLVVSSASARPPSAAPVERRRQEHEDYKRRREEDPAFVPNRGAFFMHDHRHPGPAGNGFRPFGRGRGRGGRFGVGGPFAPFSHMHHPTDPTTNSAWTHDMHEAVAETAPRRPRQMPPSHEGPPNGTGFIPTCRPSSVPINRTLSTEKHVGNAQVRVSMPHLKAPAVFPGVAVKQYTKLPDHRPPLRSDKPVRISLPYHPPRYVFPAPDRSFTFIPRALRPNQQRVRGKPRSSFGSVGGYSRRTSVYGGSYYGSAYTASVAPSRRSSVAQERDIMFSPTGSAISRAQMPADNSRPVVRLPSNAVPSPVTMPARGPHGLGTPMLGTAAGRGALPRPVNSAGASITQLPQPRTHPLPQKPASQENRPSRSQKNMSVADYESPASTQGVTPPAFQQAFHQQVPIQVANGYGQASHSRRSSHHQQVSGTPLSQIPERAIHAPPFQPNAYGQAPYYGQQMYAAPPPQGYYYPPPYPPSNMAPSGPGPGYVHSGPPAGMPPSYGAQSPPEQAGPSAQDPGQNPSSGSNLVAQEVNGMVYYFDASQIAPPVTSYPQFSTPPPYQQGVMGMGGMMTPSPDGFYYPQHAAGMVYYPQ